MICRPQLLLSLALAGLAVITLVLVGCSGGDDEPPTATAILPTSSPTTSMPSPTEPSVELYPADTLTGVVAVDRVIDAAYRQDTPALLAQAHYFAPKCAVALDNVLPDCPEGTPEGTPIVSSLHARCDRGWVSREVLESRAREFGLYLEQPLSIYAVAKLGPPDRPINDGGDPPADYLIVLGVRGDPAGHGRAFMVNGQGVVKFAFGCSPGARNLLDAEQANGRVQGFVLPPKS